MYNLDEQPEKEKMTEVSEIQNNTASKLKKIRQIRKLTMSDLARLSGVHQTTISAIENEKHSSPSLDTIERLAKALRVSPIYFFEDRVQTPFDLYETLPEEIVEFLLLEDSLPYLMLSNEAYRGGVSSETLNQLLSVLQQTASQMAGKNTKKRNTRSVGKKTGRGLV